MKLEVPFYESVKDTDCGPLALRMALGYLGEDHDFDTLAALERQLDTGLVWTVGIARAAKKLGFLTHFISTSNFNPEEDDIAYYKKYSHDKGMLVLKELTDEVKEFGVKVFEKDMPLEELLSFVTEESIPIVLLNWSLVRGRTGYNGHFVPITGYDDEFVYVHNPGLKDPTKHLPIARALFLKAWESEGTDKDTVVLYMKSDS